MENQTKQNTADIKEIKETLHTISTNHLFHLEKDVQSLDKRLEKMDMRVWAVLIMLVASTVFALVGDKL